MNLNYINPKNFKFKIKVRWAVLCLHKYMYGKIHLNTRVTLMGQATLCFCGTAVQTARSKPRLTELQCYNVTSCNLFPLVESTNSLRVKSVIVVYHCSAV